jgi:NAD(P)H-flavin reductase
VKTTENPFTFRKALVVSITKETPETSTYRVKLGGDYTASPGQFNMIYVYGLGEVPVSISSPILPRGVYTLVDHTIRLAGAVTRAILLNVGAGSVIGVRGPYGRGWPLREIEGRDVVIIAGGIGLAPLRPVIKLIQTSREKYGRVNILYGAKRPEYLLYKYELEDYATMQNTMLLLSSDTPTEGWRHYVGFVTELVKHVDVNSRSAAALVCGPEAMMRAAIKNLVSRGFSKENIYVSMERRMRCGVGVCGTCQLGHFFVCRDGPVFRYSDIEEYFWIEGI